MGLWDNHGPRRLVMELRTACSPIKLDICYASTCSTVRLTTRLQFDHRATHRPPRSNTTPKHKQIRAEIRHHTYNTQRFSPLPISIPAKQISIICNPSSHRIQISVSPMQNPQKCSIARSKFYQTQKIAFCK